MARPAPVTLLLATRNAHKAGEIRAILGDRFHCLTLADFADAPKTVEDADTFARNAAKKAVEVARWLAANRNSQFAYQNGFVLADDSGLEVEALDGAPGVHSARFAALDIGAAGNSSDAENNAKLLRLMQHISDARRIARFRCVLALAAVPAAKESIGNPHLFEGVCEGRIGFSPRGKNGFGYDPLFVPEGFEQTLAELGEPTKNEISHRARALRALRQFLGDLDGNHSQEPRSP